MRFLLAFVALLLSMPAASQGHFGFEGLERSLRLNPYQQQQFDAAVAATQRAMVAIGLGAIQAKSRLAQELLKDRPDPEALRLAQDELVDFAKPHVRAAHDEWRRLYALMDDDQVRIARAFVEEKLRKLEEVGAYLGRHLQERLQRP